MLGTPVLLCNGRVPGWARTIAVACTLCIPHSPSTAMHPKGVLPPTCLGMCRLDPSPVLVRRPKSAAKAGALASFLAGCPENAFQRVPPGYAPFSPAQRAGAVVRNGAKLLGVGFGASLVGVTMTNLLIGVRQQLDPSFAPPNAPQVAHGPRVPIWLPTHAMTC